jgi:hypothetical protein
MIDFCMIVFNGDYVLQENITSIYPFANKIIITEGPVSHYQKLGFTTSTDQTVEIIQSFPDPDKKITLIRGQWNEKDEMVKAQEQYYSGEYVWHIDSDEIYKSEDMANIIDYLVKTNCHSMAFRLYSFYGGFGRYISGFEENFEVTRIQKRGRWKTHRPPTMVMSNGKTCKEISHINQFESEKLFGARIYHYPYVFPSQAKVKIDYYKSWGGSGIISNYWENIFVPWIRAQTEEEKLKIEAPYLGVQEWIPSRRGPAFTKAFNGRHPDCVENNLEKLNQRIQKEIVEFGI